MHACVYIYVYIYIYIYNEACYYHVVCVRVYCIYIYHMCMVLPALHSIKACLHVCTCIYIYIIEMHMCMCVICAWQEMKRRLQEEKNNEKNADSGQEPDSTPGPKPPAGQELSPIPSAKPSAAQELSPIPRAKPSAGHELSPIPTAKRSAGHELSPIPGAKHSAEHNLSPIPRSSPTTDRQCSPVFDSQETIPGTIPNAPVLPTPVRAAAALPNLEEEEELENWRFQEAVGLGVAFWVYLMLISKSAIYPFCLPGFVCMCWSDGSCSSISATGKHYNLSVTVVMLSNSWGAYEKGWGYCYASWQDLRRQMSKTSVEDGSQVPLTVLKLSFAGGSAR